MRRWFLLIFLLALVPVACVIGPPKAIIGVDPSIAQLQDDLAKGRTTARAVTDHYIARIATIDASGPSLQSANTCSAWAWPRWCASACSITNGESVKTAW